MHRFEQAEERTHELEDMSIEIIQSEEQKEKQWGKKKDRTSRTSEILSRVLMYAELKSHKKVREKRTERVFEDIMTKILLNLMNLESSKSTSLHTDVILNKTDN